MKKYIKTTIKVCVFLLLLVLTYKVFYFAAVEDINSYTKVAMHEMYTTKENIDVLFLGASHCYRSVDPKLADEMLGCNTFNMGSSAQRMDASYFLLKETAKKNKIKTLFLDIDYEDLAYSSEYKDEFVSSQIILDYLKPSLNKMQYWWSVKNYSGNTFKPMVDFETITDLPKLFENAKKKLELEFDPNEKYKYVVWGNEQYNGKGYVASNEKIANDGFCQKMKFPETIVPIDDYSKKYLDKIIDFCKQKNIELILVSTPVTKFQLFGCENYDNFNKHVMNIAKENSIKFYNFNLYLKGVGGYSDDKYKDFNHLNKQGATQFTSDLCKVYLDNKAGKNLSHTFCSYTSEIVPEISQKEQVLGIIIETQLVPGHVFKLTTVRAVADLPVYFTVLQKNADGTFTAVCKDVQETNETLVTLPSQGEYKIQATVGKEKIREVKFIVE